MFECSMKIYKKQPPSADLENKLKKLKVNECQLKCILAKHVQGLNCRV